MCICLGRQAELRARWAGFAAVAAAAVALDYVLQVRVFVCVFAIVGGLSCVLDGQALLQCRQQQWHWTTCCRCVCLCVYLLV